MDETLFCIWLQCAFGAGSAVPEKIIRSYPNISDFFEGGVSEWRLSGLLSEQQIIQLSGTRLSDAAEIFADCKRCQYHIIARTSPLYPERLKEIPDPPAVLYVAGEWPDIDNELCISIVGTRDASPMGIAAASRIAGGLAQNDAIVISGGAVGIDTAAHKGVLLNGGRTLAVLGCGINADYLRENREMRNEIRKNGALISEYPPGTPPRNYHFPIRNRIISGLSLGTIVVEAGERSGAMITAQTALEQNRDVYAVFRNPKDHWSAGVRKLVSDGAKPVSGAEDILIEYLFWIQEHTEKKKAEAEKRRQLMAEEAARELPELCAEPLPIFSEIEAAWNVQQTDAPSKPAVPKRKAHKEPLPELSEEPLPKRKEWEAVWKAEDRPNKAASAGEPKPKTKSVSPKIPVQQENAAPTVQIPPEGLSEEAGKLFAVLQPEELHIDILTERAGLSVRDVLMAVTELEMEGLIRSLPGKRYARA